MMNTMKKLLALLLALLMIASLAACGSKKDDAGDTAGDQSGDAASAGDAAEDTDDNPYGLDYTSEDLQSMTDERASEEKLIEAKEYFIDGLANSPAEFSKKSYRDLADYIGVDASEYQHYESWHQDRYTWYVEGSDGACLMATFDGSGNLYAVTASVG